MKTPKKFIGMTEQEKLRYAMKAKESAEKAADMWSVICRKLATSKVVFTKSEIDLIDCLLDKEQN